MSCNDEHLPKTACEIFQYFKGLTISFLFRTNDVTEFPLVKIAAELKRLLSWKLFKNFMYYLGKNLSSFRFLHAIKSSPVRVAFYSPYSLYGVLVGLFACQLSLLPRVHLKMTSSQNRLFLYPCHCHCCHYPTDPSLPVSPEKQTNFL